MPMVNLTSMTTKSSVVNKPRLLLLAGAAALGLLGYYGASILDFLGLQYISAGLERLILFAYPTLVVLFSALFLGKPITRRAAGSIALCYAGIALAVAHDLDLGGDAHEVWLGGALVFGSASTTTTSRGSLSSVSAWFTAASPARPMVSSSASTAMRV